MYRIDNSTAATTLPTPGAVGPNPNGFFTVGDPASGIPATIVDGDWMNAVQEELANAITGDGTALSKTDRTQLAAKLKGRLLNIQVITANGTYNPTPGANSARIRGQGAGAGAGGSPGLGSGSAQGVATGGAGAGGFFEWFGPVASIAGATMTIGAAGTGGAPGQTLGGTGGATSFIMGSVLSLTANGGSGSLGPAGSTQTVGSPGGSGGTASSAAATVGTVLTLAKGDAGTPGLWFAITGGSLISGKGGSSRFGGAGNSVANSNGENGQGHGAGGSGASCSVNGSNTSSGFTGGSGSNGIIIIEEYS
ncbi:MAG TPA: hypothetical protein VL614_05265 [Acetobacteraceae bacterium]|jgi:hypothetical protein|nr:hypothetical protein [Acetobacteraceae bacterium]